jgi:polysaccharide chain length determinant protein (PEP-CTERM system associated)
MGLSTVGSYFVPKEYEAATTILIQRELMRNPLLSERELGRPQQMQMQMQQQIGSISKLVTSYSSLLAVIQRLQLLADLEDETAIANLIQALREGLDVRDQGQDLFQISYRGTTPRVTRDIATAVANIYIEGQNKLRWDQNSGAVKFIEDQLPVYKDTLEQSERALKQFKEANLGQMPGAENTNLSKLENVQKALTDTEVALKEALLKKALLEKQLAVEHPVTVAFTSRGAAEPPEVRVRRLEAELAVLLTNYSKKYPEVIRVQSEIEQSKQQLAQTGRQPTEPETLANSAMNPVYQKLRQDLADIDVNITTLKMRQKLYQEQSTQYSAKVQTIPAQELEHLRLNRDYNVNEGIYHMLLRRLEEAKITREMDVNNKGDRFLIVDQAVLPILPVKPNRVKIMLFGFIIGAMVGVGIIYLLEYSDSSLRDVREAETLFSLPVLAIIPQIVTPKQRWHRRLRNGFGTSCVVLGMLLFIILLSFEVLKARQPTLTIQEFLLRLSPLASNLISQSSNLARQ